METSLNDQFNAVPEAPQRPEFLKVLCILSFIACGLMILIYALGTMCLAIDSDTVNGMWQQVVDKNPKLEDTDPIEFFHNVGMVCFYGLLANIFSLIGVILMWRLEKIGFFIYAIAELSVNFFSLDLNMAGDGTKSYGGMIFGIVIDLIFIVMYFLNLKYMNKKAIEVGAS